MNYIFNDKFRHVWLRHHCIRELLDKDVTILDVRSLDNLFEIMTKGFSRIFVENTSRRVWLWPTLLGSLAMKILLTSVEILNHGSKEKKKLLRVTNA